MKLLKKIAVVVGLLLLVIVGVGFLLPASTEVSRSIIIERDPASVFKFVENLRAFNQWSPWAKRDPETQYTFSGPPTGTGAKMSWRSEHPQVGSGSQEIIESIENKKVTVKLEFEGQGEATAYYLLEPQDDFTKVTWGFSTGHGYNPVSRYFGLMLDTWLGPEYEAGLEALKKLLEE